MMTELTKEQEAAIPPHVDMWIARGLATEPFTREEASDILNKFNKEIMGRGEIPVVVTDSPVEAFETAVILHLMSESGFLNKMIDKLGGPAEKIAA